MENITREYFTRAEIGLLGTTLLYFLMNGAQIFETLVFVTRWTASPPNHFSLLVDGRGVSLKTFWTVFHSIHEVTFILAIIFCWKIDMVRNWLVVLFLVHFAVRVWTLAYFAPQIMDFQKIAGDPALVKDLVRRTALWQTLNYVRVALFLAISIGLIPLCLKLLSMKS